MNTPLLLNNNSPNLLIDIVLPKTSIFKNTISTLFSIKTSKFRLRLKCLSLPLTPRSQGSHEGQISSKKLHIKNNHNIFFFKLRKSNKKNICSQSVVFFHGILAQISYMISHFHTRCPEPDLDLQQNLRCRFS